MHGSANTKDGERRVSCRSRRGGSRLALGLEEAAIPASAGRSCDFPEGPALLVPHALPPAAPPIPHPRHRGQEREERHPPGHRVDNDIPGVDSVESFLSLAVELCGAPMPALSLGVITYDRLHSTLGGTIEDNGSHGCQAPS